MTFLSCLAGVVFALVSSVLFFYLLVFVATQNRSRSHKYKASGG